MEQQVLDFETLVASQKPHIHSISEITRAIRALVEEGYPDVWVCGEVSNFRDPGSGHFYFTLKDASAQVAAVMFRGANQKLSFKIENGTELICHGRISVYEARGNYQIVIDHCEPKGVGALQLAFEQLKKKLAGEGLFDPKQKKKLPFLPAKIGIVTSETGAAIRDMIKVLHRRMPSVAVLLVPVKVQGEGAAAEITAAITLLNRRDDIDVMIVGRGGGSLEDLWVFNEEIVARAIFASRIPVVSAVGHEIDFTIADFVADVRAPTPSAAAEIVVPNRADLIATVQNHAKRLEQAVVRNFPQRMMQIDGLRERLQYSWQVGWNQHNDYLKRLMSNLDHLSPLHILGKGYSVVTREGSTTPLKSARGLKENDPLQIRFAEGHVQAQVVK